MNRNVVSRRRALRTGALFLGALAGCSGSPGTDSPTGSDQPATDSGEGVPGDSTDRPALANLELRGEPLATGFGSPIAVAIPQSGRTFVADQAGQIYVVGDEGRRETPFLDVSDRMVDVSGITEQGLLGFAFHPDYGENGRFFIRYSTPPRAGTPDDYSHTFVLSEFRADPSGETADPDSETVLLEVPEPQSNHNAGAITFGPDGFLYVAVGDGGAGGDQGTGHVDDWYDAVEGGNGQDVTENLLGSILRIDVHQTQQESDAAHQKPTASEDVDGEQTVRGEQRSYAIPDDNPLVGSEGMNEQYAWGFRNPWRMSFGPDGRLFAADVGQNAYEEVDIVERGGNYGWNVMEGTHCYGADSCPDETPDGDPLRSPIIEYPHSGAEVSGISVIGGYLYDGDDIPALQGSYIFADWRANGRLFVADERDDGLWPTTAVPIEGVGANVLSFGRTAAGELLVCTTDGGGVNGSSGAVYRLRAA